MGKTWNVNGLDDDLARKINHYKNNPTNEETMTADFVRVFEEYGIKDSEFKLFQVSISGDLAKIEGKDAKSYARECAKIVNNHNEKKSVSQDSSNELKKPNEETKSSISLDISALSPNTSMLKIKSMLIDLLVEAGINPYQQVSDITIKNIDTSIDLEQIKGRPLIDGLVDIVYDMHKKQKGHSSSSSTKQENESEESFTDFGEGTSDINFFVGYDKEGVARLFEGRPKLAELFKEFVEKYNYIMTLFTTQKLDEALAGDKHNDILPYFHTMASACSSYGGEGSQIKNLCDGMMSILKDAYTAEKNGKDLDAFQTKLNIEKMRLSYTDDDGKTVDCVNFYNEAPKNQTFAGGINELVGSTRENGITYEDFLLIKGAGLDPAEFYTHSAIKSFKSSPEFDLLPDILKERVLGK